MACVVWHKHKAVPLKATHSNRTQLLCIRAASKTTHKHWLDHIEAWASHTREWDKGRIDALPRGGATETVCPQFTPTPRNRYQSPGKQQSVEYFKCGLSKTRRVLQTKTLLASGISENKIYQSLSQSPPPKKIYCLFKRHWGKMKGGCQGLLGRF